MGQKMPQPPPLNNHPAPHGVGNSVNPSPPSGLQKPTPPPPPPPPSKK